MVAAVADAFAASRVIIEWGNNSMNLNLNRPVLTFSEITEAVRKRFPGIRPMAQYLEKGTCRIVFRESDFNIRGAMQ